MSLDEANAMLMTTGAKAFPFERIGDGVEGIIRDAKKVQQTEMTTNAPKFFPSGDPMMMVVVTLATELQESDEDDGTRTLWAKGGNATPISGHGLAMMPAIRDAVIKSGATGMESGGWLKVTHTGEGKPAVKGHNPSKLYVAEYRPPTANVSVDDLS